jgi:hypothetical protein
VIGKINSSIDLAADRICKAITEFERFPGTVRDRLCDQLASALSKDQPDEADIIRPEVTVGRYAVSEMDETITRIQKDWGKEVESHQAKVWNGLIQHVEASLPGTVARTDNHGCETTDECVPYSHHSARPVAEDSTCHYLCDRREASRQQDTHGPHDYAVYWSTRHIDLRRRRRCTLSPSLHSYRRSLPVIFLAYDDTAETDISSDTSIVSEA